MRRILLVIVIGLLSAVPVLGQDFSGETKIIYYEYDYSLDFMLIRENVCLERVIQLNPDLDYSNVEYGQAIIIPRFEPCYLKEGAIFSDDREVSRIPRLKYFENGEWLDEPYYSDHVIYVEKRPSNILELARLYQFCVDDLLLENILLHDYNAYRKYAHITSLDIFLPQQILNCGPPSKMSEIKIDHGNLVSPKKITDLYNICPEAIQRTNRFFKTTSAYARQPVQYLSDTPPCYNEFGQRLQYFDIDNGERLLNPQYTDLKVITTLPNNTFETIATTYDVCLIDLLRLNGFPVIPPFGKLELLIPPARSCPTDIYTMRVSSDKLKDIEIEVNVCSDILRSLNPQLNLSQYPLSFQSLQDSQQRYLILVPNDAPSCFRSVKIQPDDTFWDMQDRYNVCYEEFIEYYKLWYWSNVRQVYEYIPTDALPCFNEQGQRLYYPNYPRSTDNPYYVDAQIHTTLPGETVYDISKKYNVCVHDLLKFNRALRSQGTKWWTSDWRAIIPETRPCYDAVTGMQLIYEDENGQLLDELVISDKLIHYGSWRDLIYYNYYNVCSNRVRDINQAKLDGEESYLGWIIPTDRPPCYGGEGWKDHVDYVCYNQLIDMSVDYRKLDEVISYDVNGKHCYDLADESTIIWYENEPYEALTPYELMVNIQYIPYCLRFPDYEIQEGYFIWNTVYSKDYTCLIQQNLPPVENPSSVRAIHIVQQGETLSSIGKLYDIPRQLIASANGLDPDYKLWAGEHIIIPNGFTWTGLFTSIASVMGIISVFGYLIWRKRQTGGKKKKRMTA